LEALGNVDDEVIVVGHSLAGLAIPLVAAARRVDRLVFLCALLPTPGSAWREQFATDGSMIVRGFGHGLEIDEQGRTFWADPALAIESMYADCDGADAASAVARLRSQGQAPYNEVCPLNQWPDVASTYIVACDDRVVSAEWARSAARDRLGAAPIELPGSHSPFSPARPS
jgi:hypothetical protein